MMQEMIESYLPTAQKHEFPHGWYSYPVFWIAVRRIDGFPEMVQFVRVNMQ